MTDIFDEVEEDLRRERLAKVWDRYGIYVITVAVLVVVVTAGWRGYEWWRVNSERSAGEEYAALLADVDAQGPAADTAALAKFAEDAPSGFSVLARFRKATAEVAAGEPAAATETLRAISGDSGVPNLYRDLARVREGQILIDTGDTAGAQEVLVGLAENISNPFNRSATELMGLAAYAEDDLEDAKRWFTELSTSATVGQGMRQRATTMLSLIERVSAQEAAVAARDAAADAADAAARSAASEAGDGAPAFPMPGADATGTTFPKPGTPSAGGADTSAATGDSGAGETAAQDAAAGAAPGEAATPAAPAIEDATEETD
ncbi:tetratricopeptide repeat protein [Acuticoccus sp. I52.16.1]|uniref:tetratricopeptide repeat protein n=1 Tax=Acuticoccus sp. I52.16.1 TaxID=2928472 RepID=UPI001FD28ECE|nr:tetratricopeptide repeat protein [Acuticoccus sp. I52.16.1]UOM33353.1 tetratricopeptide repeat protein [Acuticoccus sp. I52.16.1]